MRQYRLRQSTYVASLLLALTAAADVRADTLGVQLDQAKILKLPDNVSTIVIGNPMIADGSLQPGGLLIVTGKAFGQTNLIVLDSKGGVLADHQIQVSATRQNVVTLQRGPERESYTCHPRCDRVIMLGDSQGFFDGTIGQSANRNTQSQGK